MTVAVKTSDEIERMRIAGRLASEVLDFITLMCARRDHGAAQRFVPRLHGEGAADGAGASQLRAARLQALSEVDLHLGEPPGVPRRAGRPGAQACRHPHIDVTVIKDGFHGDCSRMFYVGEPNIQARRLVEITHQCMWLGIAQVRPGARLGDVGAAIQTHAEKHGFSVVREFCGHGIGRKFHEEPQVLHYGKPGSGLPLEPGMTFTIEPMINAGKREFASSPTAGRS